MPPHTPNLIFFRFHSFNFLSFSVKNLFVDKKIFVSTSISSHFHSLSFTDFFLNPTISWKLCSDTALLPTIGISANNDKGQGLTKHGFSEGLVHKF